ncbi:hypothetical protein [Hyphomicrobium sp. MC1]|uniref:hypothetical protein n=1 Tax=Hyphomicrobium sp. (strain MC1) TaxID=717785 RepID=UPI000213EF78|nr:hypothetical protein [Hyphomicrobium sp. MC1]CCB64830.1 protein of unknown function [Hyphomicrobium sp. MC1]
MATKSKSDTRPTPFPLRLEPKLRKRLEDLAAAERRTLTNFISNVIQDRVDGGLEAGSQYSYSRKKLWEALYSLVGDGPMDQRLGHAFTHLLILQSNNDMPESLREKFQSLMSNLERHAFHSRTEPVKIRMKSPDADRAAEEILSLYTDLRGGI